MPPARRRWLPALVVDAQPETPTARTLVLDVPGWPGHLAGQHLDVRLTAADGYAAQRTYSIATPDLGARLELTVQLVRDGEVSDFLVNEIKIGDPLEVRGPAGLWFVWRPGDPQPVLLVAGGSGIAPLMAMLRARRQVLSSRPFHLVYSVRSPADVYYASELRELDRTDGVRVTVVHTRNAPPGDPRPPQRLTVEELTSAVTSLPRGLRAYVCGPSGFVEAVADILVGLGVDAGDVRTERFGPT